MSPEQEALLRRAQEEITVAELLVVNQYYKVAVSRAYYAMFYAAQAMLLSKGLAFSKHSAVIAAFGQHFVASGLVPSHLHRAFIDAQDERNRSDYDYSTNMTSSDANDQIRSAEQFVRIAIQILGPLPPINTIS